MPGVYRAKEIEMPTKKKRRKPPARAPKRTRVGCAELLVHMKQGDDLASHLDRAKSPAEALRAWAECLRGGIARIERVAAAIDGANITLEADTHMVMFDAQDQAGERKLAELVNEDTLFTID